MLRTILIEKAVKRNYSLKFLFLPAELERGTKALQFDVCCQAIDQNFHCGGDRYAILRLDCNSARRVLIRTHIVTQASTPFCGQ